MNDDDTDYMTEFFNIGLSPRAERHIEFPEDPTLETEMMLLQPIEESYQEKLFRSLREWEREQMIRAYGFVRKDDND